MAGTSERDTLVVPGFAGDVVTVLVLDHGEHRQRVALPPHTHDVEG